jgi:hypothetical protein
MTLTDTTVLPVTAENVAGLPDQPLEPDINSLGELSAHAAILSRKVKKMETAVDNAWTWWQSALANPSEIGKSLPVHDGDVHQGYYRTKFKGGKWEPVAIWYEDGEWLALRSDRNVNAGEIWTFACRNPISYEAYEKASMTGEWADQDEVVTAQVNAGVGHNSGEVDEAEALADQIAAAEKGTSSYAKITDDETLAKAQSLRARLLELKGEGEKKHKKEKEPHLEAGRTVDKKWLTLVKRAEAAAKAVRDAMETWETEKLRRRREEERRAEDLRLAAEKAAREAEAANLPAPTVAPVQTTEPAAALPIRGSYGRAASVGVINVVTKITDQDKLYGFLKDHPDLKTCMFDLAKRAVAKGHTVPGVQVDEVAKVA